YALARAGIQAADEFLGIGNRALAPCGRGQRRSATWNQGARFQGAQFVERRRPLLELGVAGVDAGGEFNQIAREEHALRRHPDNRAARGVPGPGLGDPHFELAEPKGELAMEGERWPGQAGDGTSTAEEPREATDLALHVLRAA